MLWHIILEHLLPPYCIWLNLYCHLQRLRVWHDTIQGIHFLTCFARRLQIGFTAATLRFISWHLWVFCLWVLQCGRKLLAALRIWSVVYHITITLGVSQIFAHSHNFINGHLQQINVMLDYIFQPFVSGYFYKKTCAFPMFAFCILHTCLNKMMWYVVLFAGPPRYQLDDDAYPALWPHRDNSKFQALRVGKRRPSPWESIFSAWFEFHPQFAIT